MSSPPSQPSPTPSSTPRIDQDARPARRERRNWRLRAFFAISQRRGPVRYWPLAAAVVAVAVVGIVLWAVLRPTPGAVAQVPYSMVAEAIAEHHVARLTVQDGGAQIVVTLRAPVVVHGTPQRQIASAVPARGVSLADLERWSASGAEVEVTSTGSAPSAQLAVQLLGVLLVAGLLGFVVVRHQRGGIASGRFLPTPPDRQITLAQVGGAREAQADLRDVIAYLRDPARFRALGARCPKGILLIGPPGTGKTLLARAVAGEAGCPVIMAAGSDFNEVYVGVGSRRIRALAKQAREMAPCIVFVDEFDSLGGRRGRPNRSGEEEVTLNQLLVEMDGMAANEGVIWMAATNREDMLDPAVRRPGRFDRVVEVPLPTATDRLEILRIQAAQSRLADDVDLERLAQLTVGHSGAELANLLNEAAIIAVQQDSDVIRDVHVEQARDKVLLGRVRSGVVIAEAERQLIAVHEAGHAIVGLVTCPEDKLHKVTIEARGRSLGAAHFAPEADRHLHPRHYLEGVIAKALGGRAAELVFCGPSSITSGAGSDLVHATSIARRMVGEFGMSDEVGLISADPNAQGGAPSAQLQSQIDGAIRALLATQGARAERIVRRYRTAVQAVADALVQHNVLPAAEVIDIAVAHGVEIGSRE